MPVTCLGLQASQWPKWSADPVLKGLTAHLLALRPVQPTRGSLPRAPGHCKLVLLLESSAHMCLLPTSSGPPKAGLEPHCWPLWLLESTRFTHPCGPLFRAHHRGAQPPERYLGGPGLHLASASSEPWPSLTPFVGQLLGIMALSTGK